MTSQGNAQSTYLIRAIIKDRKGRIRENWRGKGGREDLGGGLYQNYAGKWKERAFLNEGYTRQKDAEKAIEKILQIWTLRCWSPYQEEAELQVVKYDGSGSRGDVVYSLTLPLLDSKPLIPPRVTAFMKSLFKK